MKKVWRFVYVFENDKTKYLMVKVGALIKSKRAFFFFDVIFGGEYRNLTF